MLKSKNKEIIQNNLLKIQYLKDKLVDIDYTIYQYENKLDSISKLKNKVKFVYTEVYSEIEQLSDTAIEDYWINEFEDRR